MFCPIGETLFGELESGNKMEGKRGKMVCQRERDYRSTEGLTDSCYLKNTFSTKMLKFNDNK